MMVVLLDLMLIVLFNIMLCLLSHRQHMLLNMASRSIFIMVREVRQYLAHGAVEPVSPTGQTGHGGPVPTGSGALVAHPASPKIIASVPHVLANFS